MKKFTSILLALALLFSMTACGGDENAKEGKEPSTTSSDSAQNDKEGQKQEEKQDDKKQEDKQEEKQDDKQKEEKDDKEKEEGNEGEEEGLKIVDGLGREVVLPKDPQRVLALNSAMMESFFILGITPVGKVDNYKIREEGIALPSVGTPNNINLEKVYELEPDFIVAHTRFHSAIVDDLERTGAVVYFINPTNYTNEETDDWQVVLARSLDKVDEWEAYQAELDTLGKKLGDEIRELADIKTGVMLNVGEEVTAAQKACGFGIVMDKLGIENIVPSDLPDAKKKSWVKYNVENIVEADPDVVLILANSKDKEENKQSLKNFKNDPKWSSLTAVKENRVFILPFSVNPNRSSFQGMIEKTANTIKKGLSKGN